MSQIILTYRYRLLPSKAQHAALRAILDEQRQLYNGALEERIDCYRKTGRARSYIDQSKALTEWRRGDEAANAVPLNIQRWTLRRLDDAYKAFYRRLRDNDGKAGVPRFRSGHWWHSFGFSHPDGLRCDGKRLRWKSLPGGLRIHLHRPLPAGAILSCTFTKDGAGWFVCIQKRVETAERRSPIASVGIDLGLTHLATLSTGETIPNPRRAKRAAREVRRRQRALARCKMGSASRRKSRDRLVKAYHKVVTARTTYLHQVSANLVGRFDLIAVEKLNVGGLARSFLAGSIHDASWAQLLNFLAYKAENAGCEVIEVDPRFTSQACSGCGVIVKKELSQRVHECQDCGLILDRDHNAALNVLRKAVVGLREHNAPNAERARRNLIKEGIPG